MGYKNLLVAVELGHEGRHVLRTARAMADLMGAELYCVHIIEPIFIDTGSDLILDISTEMEEKRSKLITEQLHKLVQEFALSEDKTFLRVGSVKAEVMALADEQDIDLIIVGSHGRHGLALLLGSTANAILHHAQCDVLAVRIPAN